MIDYAGVWISPAAARRRIVSIEVEPARDDFGVSGVFGAELPGRCIGTGRASGWVSDDCTCSILTPFKLATPTAASRLMTGARHEEGGA